MIALDAFGLGGAELTFINHGENTVFRADIGSDGVHPYVPGRYAVRIHGNRYQTPESIASEAAWMAALAASGLAVPDPLRATDDELLVEVEVPGVPGVRTVTVLRWLAGRLIGGNTATSRFATIGELAARLHLHARDWLPPPGFTRHSWDHEGMFGDTVGFGGLPGSEVWPLVPEPHRIRWRAAADRFAEITSRLGTGSAAYGLIHADLHAENMLFDAGEVYPFDFDDCGWGWLAYDLIVPVSEGFRLTERWGEVWDALRSGYQSVAPLPPGVEHVDDFIAARSVVIGLWVIGMAQSNPRFAAMVEREIEYVSRDLEALAG